ncbi:MAG: hypothetical protein K6F96_00410 [Bacteroidales bacterium]|nr:hypothetical protein [Bacteroidales bacterium]
MDQLKMKNLTGITSENTIQHSGIAKVLWRKLEIQVPNSEIIIGGVESIND